MSSDEQDPLPKEISKGLDPEHKKIVLMGNPNVGKSVVFSRLTGAKVITSNYAGTTVDFCQGHIRVGKGKFDIIDAPGTYSLQPTNKAEEVAVEMLEQADIVVIVLDSTNLERNLFLAHEILETEKPVVIIANTIKGKGIDFMEDETKWHYGSIDSTIVEKAKVSIAANS